MAEANVVTSTVAPRKKAKTAVSPKKPPPKKLKKLPPAPVSRENLEDEKEDEASLLTVQKSREQRRRSRKTADAALTPVPPTLDTASPSSVAFADFARTLTHDEKDTLHRLHAPLTCDDTSDTATKFLLLGFMKQTPQDFHDYNGVTVSDEELSEEARIREQLRQDTFEYISFVSAQPPHFVDAASRAREYLRRTSGNPADAKKHTPPFHVT